jgi:two-component system chemotaxis response regulator CheB
MGREGRRPLRVLAADDSNVMRSVLKTLFELHASSGDTSLPRMELCGLVRDGEEALEAVRRLTPDVLLLDLEMPRMNGLEVLQKLRIVAPTLPVIMCSAHTEKGARATLDALTHGAKDYVMKPGQQKDFAAAMDSLMEQLLPKIAALAGWGLVRLEPRELTQAEKRNASNDRAESPFKTPRAAGANESWRPVEVVVIGVSTGGPSALELMLPMLPRDFAVPVLIVQHMPVLFTSALAERLDKICAMKVRQATDGAALRKGEVWLAPGDAHMEVVPGIRRMGEPNPIVKLHQGPPLNSCKPSVDYLFRAAAAMYGTGTLALVMTGMGSDGLEGARRVRDSGGIVLAQDEATSAVWGMPGRVAREGVASAVIGLPALAGALIQRVQEGRASPRVATSEQQNEVAHGVL